MASERAVTLLPGRLTNIVVVMVMVMSSKAFASLLILSSGIFILVILSSSYPGSRIPSCLPYHGQFPPCRSPAASSDFISSLSSLRPSLGPPSSVHFPSTFLCRPISLPTSPISLHSLLSALRSPLSRPLTSALQPKVHIHAIWREPPVDTRDRYCQLLPTEGEIGHHGFGSCFGFDFCFHYSSCLSEASGLRTIRRVRDGLMG